MAAREEARAVFAHRRASGNSADRYSPETTASSQETQDVAIGWLRTHYGLSQLRAGLVAGLAFGEVSA